ncbi:hypothetical protein [Thetidibacter halocola]|uniref:Uncharacterized protein n=1 Tax=Thetidibacter halocola TaxID=2827239 RepID=A0A8J7WB20_9RHOB|nr:hypothetical protein [Thetidibacter halocola]MBS0124270.1 hypothetical protein [Thetidibacter halocola]
MSRWLWFLPLAALTLVGALLAFRYGWVAANLSETAAIETYAARYMDETGSPAADCTAVPGNRVWLVIRCGSGQDRIVYRVNRFGGLVDVTVGSDPLQEPRT